MKSIGRIRVSEETYKGYYYDFNGIYYSSDLKTLTQYPDTTTASIPEGITTIKSTAFYRCNSLTSINIPRSVTNI